MLHTFTCLNCGCKKTSHNKHAKFCCIKCSVDYHTEHIKFSKNNDICPLCLSKKEIATSKYCNSCKIIVDDFNPNDNICYNCHYEIQNFDLQHYKNYGKLCKNCYKQLYGKIY